MNTIAERYLNAVAEQDWPTARGCLAEDVERIGPLGAGDTYRGREAYLAYLAQVMPTLRDYRMQVDRVVTSEEGRVVAAELSEQMVIGDNPVRTSECLVFDLDPEGLIRRIAIYIQQP